MKSLLDDAPAITSSRSMLDGIPDAPTMKSKLDDIPAFGTVVTPEAVAPPQKSLLDQIPDIAGKVAGKIGGMIPPEVKALPGQVAGFVGGEIERRKSFDAYEASLPSLKDIGPHDSFEDTKEYFHDLDPAAKVAAMAEYPFFAATAGMEAVNVARMVPEMFRMATYKPTLTPEEIRGLKLANAIRPGEVVGEPEVPPAATPSAPLALRPAGGVMAPENVPEAPAARPGPLTRPIVVQPPAAAQEPVAVPSASPLATAPPVEGLAPAGQPSALDSVPEKGAGTIVPSETPPEQITEIKPKRSEPVYNIDKAVENRDFKTLFKAYGGSRPPTYLPGEWKDYQKSLPYIFKNGSAKGFDELVDEIRNTHPEFQDMSDSEMLAEAAYGKNKGQAAKNLMQQYEDHMAGSWYNDLKESVAIQRTEGGVFDTSAEYQQALQEVEEFEEKKELVQRRAKRALKNLQKRRQRQLVEKPQAQPPASLNPPPDPNMTPNNPE